MSKRFLYLYIILILALLSSAPTYLPMLSVNATGGQGTIYGSIVRYSGEPAKQIIVWFCQVYRDPNGNPAGDIFVCDMAWSPNQRANDLGQFGLTLPREEWVIVVSYGDFNQHDYDIIEERPCSILRCVIRVFDLREGQTIDAGILETWLPVAPWIELDIEGIILWQEELN